MAQNLYLLHYNNYFNRQLKRLETIEEYNQYLIAETIPNINFNPNDGVNTEQILNWDHENPDYIIVEDDKTGALSRWFVIDSQRLRNGQYKMSLKRDSVADHLDNVMTAPCLVEKGYLPENDPFIYNNEGQAYNQIKTSETLLKDKTKIPWIVGYIPSDAYKDTGDTELFFQYPGSISNYTFDDISNYEYYEYLSENPDYKKAAIDNPNPNLIYTFYGNAKSYDKYYNWGASFSITGNGPSRKANRIGNPNINNYKPSDIANLRIQSSDTRSYLGQYISNPISSSSASNIMYYTQNLTLASHPENYIVRHLNTDTDESIDLKFRLQQYAYNIKQTEFSAEYYLSRENGKLIKDVSTDKLYRIVYKTEIIKETFKLDNPYSSNTARDNIISLLSKFLNDKCNVINFNKEYILFEIDVKYAYLTLEPAFSYIRIKLPLPKDREHLSDAPYDMFCIPYADNYYLEGSVAGRITTNKQAGLFTAINLSKELGDASLYDIQLLPYCPLQEDILENSFLDISNTKSTNVYQAIEITDPDTGEISIQRTDTILTKILWCKNSSFSFKLDSDNYKIDITSNKESSNLDMFRICSPNYNGIFEFSPSKNGGLLSYNIDCTYRPYSPYIHVAPEFSNLYGTDFNDNRGLILGGDFSLPQLSNAWANYQLNNKNYQASFDREIQSLELKNKVAQAQDWVQAIGGSFTGSAAGMGAGAAAGPWGAAIGAAIGGTVSLASGITDAVVNQKLRKDELDKTRTLFQYNLENIQAIPTSLSKSSAFTVDNKYFPFIEYYTCTDDEREAFRNKIKYQGMTIMRVGSLTEFLHPTDETFVKGRILRLEGISDDFHIVNDISQEISQGLYIGGQ